MSNKKYFFMSWEDKEEIEIPPIPVPKNENPILKVMDKYVEDMMKSMVGELSIPPHMWWSVYDTPPGPEEFIKPSVI